jgi:hypothetical protein
MTQAYQEQYVEYTIDVQVRDQLCRTHQRRNLMELILIIVLVVLVFGGGGYWGRSRGHW